MINIIVIYNLPSLVEVVELLLQPTKANLRLVFLNLASTKVIDRVIPLQECSTDQGEPRAATTVNRRHALRARFGELITTNGERDVILLRALAQREGQGPRGVEVLAVHALLAVHQLGVVPAQVEVDRVDDLLRHGDAAGAGVEDGGAGSVHGPGGVGLGPGAFRVGGQRGLAIADDDGGVGALGREHVDGAQRRAPQLVGVLLAQRRVDDLAVDVLVLVAAADGQDAVLRAVVGHVGAVEEAEARAVELAVPQQRFHERGGGVLGDGREAEAEEAVGRDPAPAALVDREEGLVPLNGRGDAFRSAEDILGSPAGHAVTVNVGNLRERVQVNGGGRV